jgi:hypothetical protein
VAIFSFSESDTAPHERTRGSAAMAYTRNIDVESLVGYNSTSSSFFALSRTGTRPFLGVTAGVRCVECHMTTSSPD